MANLITLEYREIIAETESGGHIQVAFHSPGEVYWFPRDRVTLHGATKMTLTVKLWAEIEGAQAARIERFRMLHK